MRATRLPTPLSAALSEKPAELIVFAGETPGYEMVEGTPLLWARNTESWLFQNTADCNANAREDACDIRAGSADSNLNGIPDECEASVPAVSPLGAGVLALILLASGAFAWVVRVGVRSSFISHGSTVAGVLRLAAPRLSSAVLHGVA